MRIFNTMIRYLFFAIAVAVSIPQAAHAQWSENFDSLVSGNFVAPNKGWDTWDQAASANSIASAAVASSSPNSIRITGTSDTIRTFKGYTAGKWEFKTKVFVPSTSVGRCWFILMNKYLHNTHNNQDWSVQIAFNASTNTIYSQEANVSGTLIEDAWFDLRVEIDLGANLAKIYVNNVFFAQHAWVGPNGAGGLMRIECVDLFAEHSTAIAYFDDFELNNLGHCCSDLFNIAQDGGSTALGIPLAQVFTPTYTGHACDIVTGIDKWTSSAYDLYIVHAPGGVVPTNFTTNYLYRALNQTASNTSPNGPVNATISAVNSQTILWAGVTYALIAVPHNNFISWQTLYTGTGGTAHYMYNNTTWITMTDRNFSMRITGLKSKTVVTAGLPDNYALPHDNVFRSAALNGVYPTAIWRKFDEDDINKWFGHTFTNLPSNIVRARLTFTAKPEFGSDSSNDSVVLGLLNNPSSPNPPAYWQWSRRLEQLPEAGGVWSNSPSTTFSLDLHNLPGGGNVIGMMRATGMLDVWIHDDTNVDSLTLEYWTCPANSYPFGGPWAVLGTATLNYDVLTRSLRVGNIGSSGQDGVSVDLVQGSGAAWNVHTQNDPRNNGVALSAEALVADNDTGVEELISLTAEGVGGRSNISFDFGSLGADGVDIILYDSHGTIRAKRRHVIGMTTQYYGKSTPMICQQILTEPTRPTKQRVAKGYIDGDGSNDCAIGPETFHDIARIEFCTLLPADGKHIKNVRLRAKSTGQLSISRYRPAFFDVFADFTNVGEWELGSAFGANGLTHIVHGIGDVNGTGAYKPGPKYNVKAIKKMFLTVDPKGDADGDGVMDADTAVIVALKSDDYAGLPDQTIASMTTRATGNANEVELEADLSPLGATSNLVKIYSGNSLVATVPGLPNRIGTCSNSVIRQAFDQSTGSKSWEAEFPDNTVFQIPGAVYIGDKIVITGTGATTAFVKTSNLEVLGENCQMIQVSNLETEEQTRTVRGHVDLQDFEGSVASQVVVLQIRPRDSFDNVETHEVQLDANGNYSLETSLNGEYDITCQGTHWLRKLMPIAMPDVGGQVVVDFSVVNGDVDGDNEVTLVDYGQIAAAYGSAEGDPNWNENADLNGDGEVNLVDVGILAARFGEAGDE